jgi:hypothetical protein
MLPNVACVLLRLAGVVSLAVFACQTNDLFALVLRLVAESSITNFLYRKGRGPTSKTKTEQKCKMEASSTSDLTPAMD